MRMSRRKDRKLGVGVGGAVSGDVDVGRTQTIVCEEREGCGWKKGVP